MTQLAIIIALAFSIALGAVILALSALLQSNRMETRLRSIEERVGGVDAAAEEMQ